MLEIDLVHDFCLLHSGVLLEFLRAFWSQMRVFLLTFELHSYLLKNNLFCLLLRETCDILCIVPLANLLDISEEHLLSFRILFRLLDRS